PSRLLSLSLHDALPISTLGGALLPLTWPWASMPKSAAPQSPRIKFELQSVDFRVETDESLETPHAPAAMLGGVAVFDYNKDGRPDRKSTRLNSSHVKTS